MCGRYLLEDEAYADILQILHNLNKAKRSASGGLSKDESAFGEVAVSGGSAEYSEAAIGELALGEFTHGDIFPTNIAPVATSDCVVAVKWGFPHWKKSGVIINARAETALEKKMFGKPLRESRCVVPSSGFYEWNHHSTSARSGGTQNNAPTRSGDKKQKDKYFLSLPEENVLYMAGVVNTFRDTLGNEYSAFVILTTAANDSVAPIHDRMPVILASDELSHWIDDDDFMEYILHRPSPKLASVIINEQANEYYENIFD